MTCIGILAHASYLRAMNYFLAPAQSQTSHEKKRKKKRGVAPPVTRSAGPGDSGCRALPLKSFVGLKPKK